MSIQRSDLVTAAMPLASSIERPSSATLLLRGGHRCAVALDSESALQRLSACVQDPHAEETPLRLHRPDGAMLLVHPREIVGIVTGESAADEGGNGTAASSRRGPHIRAESGLPGSPYFVAEDFLGPAEMAHVFAFAFKQKAFFSAATVTNAAADYRRSKVLYDVQGLLPVFMPKLHALMPTIWPLLKMAPAPIADIECQLTAHGAGDFFKLHNDNGAPESARRLVSYVFYFNRSPKMFSGGQLRMYETEAGGDVYACGQHFEDIEPRHNSLVVFPSHCHHEVLPVVSESDEFEDRRFTVNGWLVRAA